MRNPKVVPEAERRETLLTACVRMMWRLRCRLYMPIGLVRRELRAVFAEAGVRRTRAQLDAILREAPALFPGLTVNYSPFSGTGRGGLTLELDPIARRLARSDYVGFLSIGPIPREDIVKHEPKRRD